MPALPSERGTAAACDSLCNRSKETHSSRATELDTRETRLPTSNDGPPALGEPSWSAPE